MNPITAALIPKIRGALTGRPMLKGSILLDFTPDGRISISSDNVVTEARPGDHPYDCVIATSLATLARIQNNEQSVGSAWFWGNLKLTGDRQLGEKFGTLCKDIK